ncbi:uncharacterized protein Pyn_08151 [Prunus yedoensis var. nudiflora]|uniref:Uncharacterized protein n=1 Tax=Prunus yedoensis var. nudiflora TaxID=2094558 RepID=A0A314Y4T8_PRUYE|nr:uncharacterized protein Pyn_08151 [Prunus yedoensis var. nudiflora]
MKKKLQPGDDRELEILKAVAQAWYSHSSGSRPTSEFDAHRRNFRGRLPSRFKLEAMRKSASASNQVSGYAAWDFGQSLWDAYEIVAVSKRLETGLFVYDNPFNELDSPTRAVRRLGRASTASEVCLIKCLQGDIMRLMFHLIMIRNSDPSVRFYSFFFLAAFLFLLM